MKKWIPVSAAVILLILSSVHAQSLKTIYSVQAEIYKDDRVVIKHIDADTGLVSSFPTKETGYIVKVLSHDDSELFKANLGVSFTIIMEEAGVIEKNSTNVHFRVPYHPQASRIVIYHLQEEIQIIDLSEKICDQDMACELGENVHNCIDCPSGAEDNYCDKLSDGKCDPDCRAFEDKDCREPSGPVLPFPVEEIYLITTIIAAIVVAVVLLFMYRRRQTSKPSESEWNSLGGKYQQH